MANHREPVEKMLLAFRDGEDDLSEATDAILTWADDLLGEALDRLEQRLPVPLRCSQCGKRFQESACGPTHSLLKYEQKWGGPEEEKPTQREPGALVVECPRHCEHDGQTVEGLRWVPPCQEEGCPGFTFRKSTPPQ